MVTSTSTTQEPKEIIVPRKTNNKTYTTYHETYTWDLDPTTLVPVGVRVTRTPS
jgi:hypothetical protein